MSKILDCLPMLPRTQNVPFGERNVTVHRGALLVRLSIGLRGEERLDRLSAPFPALLDSGNNFDFYLHEHHLVNWAAIRPALLATLTTRYINRQPIPCREADVWIYPNLPGSHQRMEGKPPFKLRMKGGIAVGPQMPNQPIFPRLPLLGFSALCNNELDFWFDSKTSHCHVWTAGWRTKIIRLLSKL
jgi:hypothetical protein